MLSLRDQRLKDATRELQGAVHGVESAASITGKGKTQHGNYQNRNMPDFATIRDIALMEAVAHGSAGHPQVTRLLCELAGGVFVPLPQMPEGDEAVAVMIAQMAAELGDVSRSIADALCNDGNIDRPEAEGALRELADVERKTAQLRLLLQSIADRGR